MRIKSNDLKGLRPPVEDSSGCSKYEEQEKNADQIRNWLMSQKKGFEIELSRKPLKAGAALLAAETEYLLFSEEAQNALPALPGSFERVVETDRFSEKLSPGVWLVLNRAAIETIEGTNLLKYEMRWQPMTQGQRFPIAFGALGTLKSVTIA